jgi:hypothetical protein
MSHFLQPIYLMNTNATGSPWRKIASLSIFLLVCFGSAVQCKARQSDKSTLNVQDAENVPVFRSSAYLCEDGGTLGVCVGLRGSVENRNEDHIYELRYLIRVQNKLGTDGTILGDKNRPEGVCYTASSSQGRQLDRYGFLRLNTEVDITRRMVRELVNMPQSVRGGNAVLRVEPHVFDVTDGKYVTQARPESMILVAAITRNGNINTLQSLSGFLASRGNSGKSEFGKICQILQNLDHFDCSDNELPNALADLLEKEHLGDEIHLMLLNVTRTDWLRGPKENLGGVLSFLVENSTDERIKQHAQALLEGEQL